MKRKTKALPRLVSQKQWQAAHEKLLVKEKAATRARDALAATRRRQPMVEIEKEYVFAGPGGQASLLDLFEGRRQLIVYHFMFAPGVEGWPKAGCPGCSFVADQIGHLAHLHARGTSLTLPSREHPALQEAHGLDAALVLLPWQRLQRRLRAHDRRR
jgi:predicted dithiol-disulfide oxidoreductase (DUF899 family)